MNAFPEQVPTTGAKDEVAPTRKKQWANGQAKMGKITKGSEEGAKGTEIEPVQREEEEGTFLVQQLQKKTSDQDQKLDQTFSSLDYKISNLNQTFIEQDGRWSNQNNNYRCPRQGENRNSHFPGEKLQPLTSERMCIINQAKRSHYQTILGSWS